MPANGDDTVFACNADTPYIIINILSRYWNYMIICLHLTQIFESRFATGRGVRSLVQFNK